MAEIWRLGVDIGGTFTDLVLESSKGVQASTKVLTTYNTPEDAINLIKLIKGIPAKINLIPFNPWPGSFFETSTQKNIDNFAKILMDAGFASPIRKPRGQDIYAACGQLKSNSEKIRKSDINKLVPFHNF